MHKISYSQRAKNDLLTIWSFIADDNPIYADKVVDTIVAFIANLTYFPSLWTPISPILSLRNIVEPTFRYKITYTLGENTILIRAVSKYRE
jgi:plasmid stabilization system protein ParE